MHGRPRKSATPVDENASAHKAAKIRSLQTQFLQNHHNNIYTKEALEINAKLIEANPEFMTAWNYRKLAFEHNLSSQSEAEKADPDYIKSIIDEELRVVENALRKNFKSYGAWHHRKWVISKGNSSTERELKLLNLFQKQDTRNFHAWNYRRYITRLKDIPDEKELQFTTDMINDNFSNYSAWHNRSVLLSHLLEKKVEGYYPRETFLKDEFEFVRNAVFTDPDDQSGWFYHLWLLDQTVKTDMPVSHDAKLTVTEPCHLQNVEEQSLRRMSFTDDNFTRIDVNSSVLDFFESSFEFKSGYERPTSSKWKLEMMASEIDQYRELLSWAECKIGKLTLARLLMAYDDMLSTDTPTAPVMNHMEEVLQLYSQLMKLDPTHYQYYMDQYSLVFLKHVTSSKETLLKYCWNYNEPTSLKSDGFVSLRLNSLSLSRIGSFERLLWVQSLDLSHNQLHSIEGFEALQHLSCLNLSHNKLGSFTALDTLRTLKSLRVLDISHNEIGAHSVDTRRYLCASPMSHTLDYDKKFEEFEEGMVSYWEAYSVFGGLKGIQQLDIAGNGVAADERFLLFLVKLLPGLKWVDGEQVH